MAIDLSFGGSAFPRSLEIREFLYKNAALGQTSRFRRLERLDCFSKCLEYQHQTVGWDGTDADAYETISHQVALPHGFTQPMDESGARVAEKRPTAPARLCPTVINRFTGLLFSKSRTPKVTVEGDPEADDFLTEVWRKARFWRTMYQARTLGGAMGSCLVTVHLRRGRFSYRAHSSKTVQDVVWEDPDLKIPAGVLIQYPFTQELEVFDDKTGQPTGRTKDVTYLYRRIIDQEMDITFKPAEIQGNRLPSMEIDEYQTYRHGLGRFPGTWIFNLPSDDELDGIPDCDGAYQMFDTIDRQTAQSNSGLMANQDPTLVISRDRKEEMAGVPLRKGSDNALNVGMGGSASYLEIGGTGIGEARAFVKDLKKTAMDLVQCILTDPEKISGAAQSALAIELIYEPMLEKADRFREQYGEAIVELGEVTLEMARHWKRQEPYEGTPPRPRPEFHLAPRIEEVDANPDSPDPEAGVIRREIVRTPGEGGVLSLAWGPYFALTPTDVNTKIGNVATAYAARLIDQETAVKKIAPLLDVEDAEGLLRRVREEAEEREATAAERGGFGLYPEPAPAEEPPFPVPPGEG